MSTRPSESAARRRALSIESSLLPREVTPVTDAPSSPVKATEVDAPSFPTTSFIGAPDGARELEEDRSPIETPAEPLSLTGLPRVTRVTGAPDLDHGAADAHLTGNDNSEDTTFVDATNHFPQAGRKPREVSPAQIEECRKWFGKVLAEYPIQPAHEADDVDAPLARILPDRLCFRPFIEMINALDRDVLAGRTTAETLPSLKNRMLRNRRAVHGVGAPVRMAA
jgi:hypothetical protein